MHACTVSVCIYNSVPVGQYEYVYCRVILAVMCGGLNPGWTCEAEWPQKNYARAQTDSSGVRNDSASMPYNDDDSAAVALHVDGMSRFRAVYRLTKGTYKGDHRRQGSSPDIETCQTAVYTPA
eukprot:scaffold89863_cov24-Prasinocladus_malaysianus.AAC.1